MFKVVMAVKIKIKEHDVYRKGNKMLAYCDLLFGL
jgi:hypothetical protein